MKILGLVIMLSTTFARTLKDTRADGWMDGFMKSARAHRGDLDESWYDAASVFGEPEVRNPAHLRLVAVDGRRID